MNETIEIWPGEVPGEINPKQKHQISDNSSNGVLRISEVTNPDIDVYTPSDSNNCGAGVIVCPGGGYSILAADLEGSEIAEWLSNIGYTAFVLHYRVPQKREGALQDVQRAIRVVRGRAEEWGLDIDRLGVMGFSAGGSLSARAATLYNSNTYSAVDDLDKLSCRPNFALLIYPAYLDKGENRTITPELAVDADTPPMFMFGTADDPYGNSSLVMAGALRDTKASVEMHMMAKGGHGYGLRSGSLAAETWPKLAEIWLENITKLSEK